MIAMSLQANKKSIVAFVAGAAALGFAMTYSFGGREAFIKHETFLLYFDGSISGLDTTSLVKFRGVPIGYVDSVKLSYQQLPNDRRVPVFVKVDINRLQRQLHLTADLSDPAILEQQVRAGLRGKLEIDSYVTGKLYVDLGYYPDASKPPLLAFEMKEAVIPTIPSNSSQLISQVVTWTNMIGQYDFHGLEVTINAKLDAASAKVASIPFGEYDQKLQAVLAPLRSMDGPGLDAKLHAFLGRLQRYRAIAGIPQSEVVQQSGNMLGLTENAQASIENFRVNLKALRETLQSDGQLRQGMDQMLLRASTLANSLKQQANSLEEQPGM
jgi:paraquat-inducible protein B